MALLTINADGGSNNLAATGNLGVAGANDDHRDIVIINNSEQAMTLRVAGATGPMAWRREDGSELPGVNANGNYLTIDGLSHLYTAVYNLHTAAQTFNLQAAPTHATANTIGDTIYVATRSTAWTNSNIN